MQRGAIENPIHGSGVAVRAKSVLVDVYDGERLVVSGTDATEMYFGLGLPIENTDFLLRACLGPDIFVWRHTKDEFGNNWSRLEPETHRDLYGAISVRISRIVPYSLRA